MYIMGRTEIEHEREHWSYHLGIDWYKMEV
jgi:hypothetical protein